MYRHAPSRVLILGGTFDARALAARLADHPGLEIELSLAGRTKQPAPQPVPVRTGGFGGVEGLADYLIERGIDAMVVATHPFAARIASNAAEAATKAGVPTLRLLRPGWTPSQGDRWRHCASVEDAPALLGDQPRRVMLTIGRQQLAAFERAPQHHYLVRSVDPLDPPPALPRFESLLARGPFNHDQERALLEREGIEVLVTKNSGAGAVSAKLLAARTLGIEVVMIERPATPPLTTVANIDAVLGWVVRQRDLLAS
ncbi:cobalt-precorrin-6A reductase [Halotalea alkalilenta]|uniref:cobalt-precorrin-6A reductase n=1 Tax=Halotalea alkalilenta TaxID=376489 RepID=UPI0004839019|nr:cobalt-precorrin-6A reductase [Halotalea alkalilenta]